MSKQQPHIKWTFQLSRSAVKSMVQKGIGHSGLRGYINGIPVKGSAAETPPKPKGRGRPPKDERQRGRGKPPKAGKRRRGRPPKAKG